MAQVPFLFFALTFILKVKLLAFLFLCVIILQIMTYTWYYILHSFKLAYLHLTTGHSKGQGQHLAYFDCEYLANDDRWTNIRINITTIESIIIWLAYLHLTVAYSRDKVQGYGHA